MAIETNVDIEVTPEMLAAGLKLLRELGVIKRPTVAHEVLVAGIYKAMARSRHSEADSSRIVFLVGCGDPLDRFVELFFIPLFLFRVLGRLLRARRSPAAALAAASITHLG